MLISSDNACFLRLLNNVNYYFGFVAELANLCNVSVLPVLPKMNIISSVFSVVSKITLLDDSGSYLLLLAITQRKLSYYISFLVCPIQSFVCGPTQYSIIVLGMSLMMIFQGKFCYIFFFASLVAPISLSGQVLCSGSSEFFDKLVTSRELVS